MSRVRKHTHEMRLVIHHRMRSTNNESFKHHGCTLVMYCDCKKENPVCAVPQSVLGVGEGKYLEGMKIEMGLVNRYSAAGTLDRLFKQYGLEEHLNP